MLHIAIVIVYLAAVMAIGVLSRKKTWALEEYLVAGRKGSLLLITGSLLATIIGGSATIGVSGLGGTRGLTGAWWLLSGSVGLLVLWWFFAERVRKFGLFTLPSLIEKQYNSQVALAASILIVIAWLGVISGQIIAAGTVMSALGGNRLFWMSIFTAIFIAYTVLGGQYAVIRTDILQLCLILLGIIISVIAVLSEVGGISGLRNSLGADYFAFPVNSHFGVTDVFSSLLIIGLTYVVGPDIYSRLFSARDGRTAKLSALIAAIVLIPLAFAIVFIGMGASALLPQVSSAEQLYPALVTSVFPPLVGGIVIAALLSAIMSSADTTLLSASTIFSVDIAARIKNPLSEKSAMQVTRWAIVILGLCSLALAMRLQGVISSLLFAFTVYTGGVILPVIIGFYNKLKVTSVAALAAVCGGGISALTSKLLHIPYLDLGTLGICILLLFVVNFFTKNTGRVA
jgi:SSS family solute:Na+ symporter